jgi:hypothetical protein
VYSFAVIINLNKIVKFTGANHIQYLWNWSLVNDKEHWVSQDAFSETHHLSPANRKGFLSTLKAQGLASFYCITRPDINKGVAAFYEDNHSLNIQGYSINSCLPCYEFK